MFITRVSREEAKLIIAALNCAARTWGLSADDAGKESVAGRELRKQADSARILSLSLQKD